MTFDDHWTKVLSFNPELAENPFLRPLAEAAWNAAAVAEREACARIVVARAAKVGHRALPATVGEACATSILARSNVKLSDPTALHRGASAGMMGSASCERRLLKRKNEHDNSDDNGLD